MSSLVFFTIHFSLLQVTNYSIGKFKRVFKVLIFTSLTHSIHWERPSSRNPLLSRLLYHHSHFLVFIYSCLCFKYWLSPELLFLALSFCTVFLGSFICSSGLYVQFYIVTLDFLSWGLDLPICLLDSYFWMYQSTNTICSNIISFPYFQLISPCSVPCFNDTSIYPELKLEILNLTRFLPFLYLPTKPQTSVKLLTESCSSTSYVSFWICLFLSITTALAESLAWTVSVALSSCF